jgi:hypothetical protein
VKAFLLHHKIADGIMEEGHESSHMESQAAKDHQEPSLLFLYQPILLRTTQDLTKTTLNYFQGWHFHDLMTLQ